MNRIGTRPLWQSIAVGGTLAAGICFGLWRYSVLWRPTPLRALQETPLQTRVRLAGVVTYIDLPGKRFWIEDETGALPIQADPAALGLHAGQSIAIEGLKTHRYDPSIGPESVDLTDIRVLSRTVQVRLPRPIAVSLSQLPAADKNGIQVRISGVVRAVQLDPSGRTEILIATTSYDYPLLVPGPPSEYAGLINATIDVLGIPEQSLDPVSHDMQGRLWVASRKDLHVVQRAPQSRLYTIRGLYVDEAVRSGHLVRLRGRVAATSPGYLLLEDALGAIDCQNTSSQLPLVSSEVEVEGFPIWDGLRISLVHIRVREASADVSNAIGAPPVPLPVLDTVRAVRDLPPDRAAQALPVRLRGVLTYVDPIWRQLFIQDGTAGIYVKYSGHPMMAAGDRVTLTGLTNAGNFAPVVIAPRIDVEGKGRLPEAVNAVKARAAAGLLDSQYVSIEGIVRPIKMDDGPLHPMLTFDLMSNLGRVRVFTSPRFGGAAEARRLEDARVLVRGVFGSVFNSRRQLIGYQLLVESPNQVKILDPAIAAPFSMPATPIAALLRFSPHARYGHRVKIAGAVTLAERDFVYVQDASSGVEIRGDGSALRVGDLVEAIGYPTLAGRYSPVMTDAAFRVLGHSGDVPPRNVTAESVLDGQDDAMLVTLQAHLLMTLRGPARTTLVLQSGVRTFTAQLNTSDRGDDLGLRVGSVVRLTGVCLAQVDSNKLYMLLGRDPSDFQILLRSAQDVAVVRPAPFWTLRITLLLLGAVSLLIPTILIWVAMLRRRVHQQTAALEKAAETTQAIRDLSASMQKVGRDQRYDKHVSVRGSEEIAQLVVGFNHMLAELHSREQQKKAAESKLQHMAMVDELTGLPNRRMLFDRLSHSLAAARREDHSLALLYIDLDGFKLVNDNLGHKTGDLLLAEVAQRLRSRARASDTVARIGGDEFTLVLDRIKRPSDANVVARGLLEAVQLPFRIDGQEIRISASIGISIFPDHANEGGHLLQQADCAMYAAKHNGKSQIVEFGDHLGNAARERLILENDLRRAIADGAIDVHYQPEFDLASNTIVRFEALARWQHPSLGTIPPLQFIPIAEESGLIVPLGAYILDCACRDAIAWNLLAGRQIPVAVNVSSVQFARQSFVRDIEDTLRITGLSPHLLQLELTESATLASVERSAAVIMQLKKMGVSLALDDFGTGYSCLSYLPRLPFDALKIDRSFLSELVIRPESSALLESILTMAHNLNMRVVIEGIETEEELKAVVELGADEAQGYLLGRPSADPLSQLGIAFVSADGGEPVGER